MGGRDQCVKPVDLSYSYGHRQRLDAYGPARRLRARPKHGSRLSNRVADCRWQLQLRWRARRLNWSMEGKGCEMSSRVMVSMAAAPGTVWTTACAVQRRAGRVQVEGAAAEPPTTRAWRLLPRTNAAQRVPWPSMLHAPRRLWCR